MKNILTIIIILNVLVVNALANYVPNDTSSVYFAGTSLSSGFDNVNTARTASDKIQYGSTLYYSSYGGFGLPVPILKKELSVLEETGSDIIRIDMDESAWIIYFTNDTQRMGYAYATISMYDQIIEQIKRDNKKLMIANAGAEIFRQNPVPWNDFKATQVAILSYIASRYRPDYLEVVKEPSGYIAAWDGNYSITPFINRTQISDRSKVLNVSEWVDLTAESINAVKNVSPQTKTVIGVAADPLELDVLQGEYEYFVNVSKIDNLDILGLDTYHPDGLKIVSEYFIPSVISSGKPVWILETWWGINPDPSNDQLWLNHINDWAINNSIKGFLTFNMYFFNQYDLNPLEFRTEINATFVNESLDRRTPVFYMYKFIIERSNINQPPVITDTGYAFVDINSNNRLDNNDTIIISVQGEDLDGSIIRATADLSMLGNPYLNKVPLSKEPGFFAGAVPLYVFNTSGLPSSLNISVEITDNTGASTTELITLSPEDVVLLLSKEINLT